MKLRWWATPLLAGLIAFGGPTSAKSTTADSQPEGTEVALTFLEMVVGDQNAVQNGLSWIKANWEPGMVPMALETIRLVRDPTARIALLNVLQSNTGQTFSTDIRAWQVWLWNQDIKPVPGYALFKSHLYGLIDPAFKGYFDEKREITIDLDEVVWGGVRQDGIPPLRSPSMVAAKEAEYLADDHIVFGISINGDARAYPKRILAWHEMFVDTVGGTPVAGVYCTLCGTVILYHTTLNGTNHALGTSGFLYRSNKLMYDQATQSLWSTMRGTPVIGPLVGKEVRLARGSVVTTTWGAWRARHPNTTVLSLETGHRRDYAEGAAYRSYFATDELMFTVPKRDNRLANKAEVLVMRAQDSSDPLALASDFLAKHPVYRETLGGKNIVILTDTSGAHRVFESGAHEFTAFDGSAVATDASGEPWELSEDGLASKTGETLARVPANRAFWFGWFAAFPDTRLIK
jgi:hypothetical protein